MPVTSTTFSTLENAWNTVQQGSLNGRGYYSIRVFGSSLLSIFVGQHQPSGLIDLAFEVFPESIKKISLNQVAKGFEVVVQNTENALNVNVRRVNIKLSRNSFLDLFKVLATDIVDRCLKASSEAEAMNQLHLRLDHWRRFLEKYEDDGLSVSEQTGLFGELSFLQILLDHGVDELVALNAWHGPLRDNQDFCFGSTAVEVKSSISNSPDIITISNVRQLDEAGLAHLYLYHVSFDRRDGSGKALPDKIDELRNRFQKSGVATELIFDDLLLLQGYHHSQRYLYEMAGYSERSHNLYEVDQGFPRLLESDLIDGISGVRYKVDLSCAASFKIDLSQTVSVIKKENHE